MLTSSEFYALSLNDFLHDWKACMSSSSLKLGSGVASIPPPRGQFKWNFDGSTSVNPGPTRYGGMLRDEDGNIVWVISGPLCDGDSTKAELISLLYGLHEIKAMGKVGCLVEGDSKE